MILSVKLKIYDPLKSEIRNPKSESLESEIRKSRVRNLKSKNLKI